MTLYEWIGLISGGLFVGVVVVVIIGYIVRAWIDGYW